jgi:hypothetical protein
LFLILVFSFFLGPNRPNPCEATKEAGNKETKPHKEEKKEQLH